MALAKQTADSPAPAPLAEGQPSVTVHTDYVTAQQVPKPRDLKAIMKQAIDIAELSGELFFYRWETSSTSHKTGEVKKGFVIGHSVKLTNEAVRLFGNCVIHQKPVIQTPSAWIFTTAFVDLETGFTRERQFRMDKQWPVHGRMDRFRKDDIRFQIGQSKSDRNVVLNSLPQIILERMLEAAIGSVRKQIEFKIKDVYNGDIQKAIDELLKPFGSYAIDQGLIEQKLGLKRDKWDINTLVMLTGDLKALKGGNETKETLYSLDETEDPHGGAPAAGPENGLKPEEMKPGNPADHQGYNDKPKDTQTTPATQPAVDTTGDELKGLIKKDKDVLQEEASNELLKAFAEDITKGDIFLNECLEKKVIRSTTLADNTKGELAQVIVKLRKRQAGGQQRRVEF
jgi:hypothetical protein